MATSGHQGQKAGDLIIMDAYKIHQAYYPEKQLMATIVITDEDRGQPNNYVFAKNEVHCLIQQYGSRTPTPEIGQAQTLALVDKTIVACANAAHSRRNLNGKDLACANA